MLDEKLAGIKHKRIVVLGMGNELLKDEGVGVHVIRALQEMHLPDNVAVVDGGTLQDVPLSFEGVDKLIVVDAVRAGDRPGTIYRFRPEDIEEEGKTLSSLHQITLIENLWLMERFSQKPSEVIIIGIEPEDMSLELELSERLREQLPKIIEVVLGEIGTPAPKKEGKK
jgi:hydrogenase maturation protease